MKTSPARPSVQKARCLDGYDRDASQFSPNRSFGSDRRPEIHYGFENGKARAMDIRVLLLSLARRRVCANAGSAHRVKSPGMAVFFESHSRALDPAERGKHLRGGMRENSPPLPVFLIKPGESYCVDQPIFSEFPHFLCRLPPTRSRRSCRPDDDAARFGFQFHFICKLGLCKDGFG